MTYENELYHYGVLGMKWGRRKQAKTYRKALNKLDKMSTENIGAYMRYERKASKYLKKNKKDKAIQYATKAKQHLDLSKDIDSETFKVLAKAHEQKLSVSSRNIVRRTKLGRSFLEKLTDGSLLEYAVNSAIYKNKYPTLFNGKKMNQHPGAVVGNRYKVKTKGKSNLNLYTSEQYKKAGV